jgi:hypothetical protein
LKQLEVDGRIILKWIIKKLVLILCTGFSRFMKQSSEGLQENCDEISGCITAGKYLDAKGKRLFYGDENPERFYAEQDRVADCCEY